MIEYDVAIVGAGPAGCAAARECTRKGLTTVIVEKKKIPRHKACSGILVPASINALSEHFGEVPQDLLAVPSHVNAMRMHFPGGHVVDIPIHGRMIRRDRLDAWLCKASQAVVLDETKIQSFSERSDGVDLLCIKSNGEALEVRSQIVIAADGGASRLVKQIDPPLTAKLTWYVALQETYDCRCHLEPGFFHFFAFPEISLYPSAYVKDNLLVMEVVVRLKDKATLAMARLKEHLWKRIGIEQAHLVRRLGCRVTYAAPRGLFCFGTEQILVSGEASGLLNLFGEGISSALASGRIAGNVSFNSIRKGVSPGRLYRKEIEAEKRRTIGTFNYKTLLFREGNAFNFKKGLQAMAWKERLIFSQDLLKWLLTVKG
ncbi:MAG: FAD-dependent monooxygenase [Deltaproteobacteria bacterium]|nr:FAD-dependent monooxygenase [Deltaproteobacteria bacterium]